MRRDMSCCLPWEPLFQARAAKGVQTIKQCQGLVKKIGAYLIKYDKIQILSQSSLSMQNQDRTGNFHSDQGHRWEAGRIVWYYLPSKRAPSQDLPSQAESVISLPLVDVLQRKKLQLSKRRDRVLTWVDRFTSWARRINVQKHWIHICVV